MKNYKCFLFIFIIFFWVTVTQAFPDNTIECLSCTKPITLRNPDQYSLTVSHEDIHIESPAIGLFISFNLLNDDNPEIQLICDAAAFGETVSLNMDHRTIRYQIPEEPVDWQNRDLSISVPRIDTFQPIAKLNNYYQSNIITVPDDYTIISNDLEQTSNAIPGLSIENINKDIILKGYPEQSGSYSFTLAVRTEDLTQTVSYQVHVYEEADIINESALITLKNPDQYTLMYYHNNVPIESPALGPLLSVYLKGETQEVQFLCDATAVGEKLYVEMHDIVSHFEIPSNDSVYRIPDISIPEITQTQTIDIGFSGNQAIEEMCISNANYNDCSWAPFSSNVSWSLTNGSGNKAIFFTFRDSEKKFFHSTVSTIFDEPLLVIINIDDNDTQPKKEKNWRWHANRNSTFRFAINQSPSWQPTGTFENITSTTFNNDDGKWYIHVQAKDDEGDLSEVVSDFAMLDNTKPIITGVENEPDPVPHKTWIWNVNDENHCLFRYTINQNSTWIPSGEYSAVTTAHISGLESYGKWYLHVEAKDFAGNVSDVVSGSVQLVKLLNTPYSQVNESITTVMLQLMLSHTSSEKITIEYQTKNLQTITQATSGIDYILPDSKIVEINPGELTGFIELSIIDDQISENDESIVIELYNPSPDVQLDGPDQYTYTIIDNDIAGVSIVETFNQSEVHEGGNHDTFTISLNSAPADDIQMNINTDDQITVSPYALLFTSDNWNQEQSVIIDAVDDDIYELSPQNSLISFSIEEDVPKYTDLDCGNIAVNIIDNDSKPSVRFRKSFYEGNESVSPVYLPLVMSHRANLDVTIDYVIENYGNAIEDKDYTLPSYQTVIKAFDLEGNIVINVINDNYSEAHESFKLRISGSDHAVIGENKNTCEYEILNDDYPGMSITGLSNTITEGESFSYSIQLNTVPESRVTINIQLDDNNLLHISNNALYFTRDNWNTPQWVTLNAIDDNMYYAHLQTMIRHTTYSSDPDYHNLPEKVKTITIHENDQAPSPPEITANTPTNEIDVIWHIESGGGNGNFECKLNSQPIQCASGQMSTNFPEGKHVLSVIEEISSGRWTEAFSFEMEKDTGMPCSQIDVPNAITAENKSFTITYSYEDKYQCQTYNNKACGTGIDHCPTLVGRGSGVQEIELWVQLPNSNEFQWIRSDKNESIDGYFNYTASQEGVYRFYTRAIDRAGNSESEPYQPDSNKIAESFYVNNFSGYAIIAVGSVADQEGLKSHTLTANNIVKQLKYRNFWPEHIKYLNPYAEKQPGETDFEAHGETYLDAFENVITRWAPAQIQKLSGPLYIILIDHGSPNIFHLTGTQSLNATQLNHYLQILDDIENKSEIIIILGTCYSGSFMDDIAAKGRVVITSAAENEPSYRGPHMSLGGVRDGGFFITNLFNELASGRNLMDSFNTAVLRTEAFTFSAFNTIKAPFYDFALQHPLLDDNGKDGHNFLPFNGDGAIAKTIIMGHNDMASVSIKSINMEPEKLNHDENELTIEAYVNDSNKVDRVWIEVRKPDMIIQDMSLKDMSDYIGLQQSIESKEFEMTIHSNNTYTVECDEFDIPGKYMIFFYVKDKEGFTSGYKEAVIYKSKENNQSPLPFSLISPMNIENDYNETEFSDVILVWEKARDLENDQITYAITLSTDTDTYVQEDIFHTICFVSLPKSWDKKEVQWKVQAIDTFGNISETPTWKFKIDNKIDDHNDIWGAIVYFQVHDIDTKKPIPNAQIKMTSSEINQDYVMNQNGLSINRFMKSGMVNLAISADNYSPIHNETIEIIHGEMQSFNFSLDFKSIPGDINRNGKRDIGDAIQCLQVLSGLDEQFYYDSSVLIGEMPGLGDGIFILQQLSK
jgi:hypothetical protein